MSLKIFLLLILISKTNCSISSIFKDISASLKAKRHAKPHCDAEVKDVCDENQLMLQLAKLYIISPERIILQLTCSTVADMCKELKLVLNKLNQQFQSCSPLPKDNLYMKLLAGAHVLNQKICLKDDSCKRRSIL